MKRSFDIAIGILILLGALVLRFFDPLPLQTLHNITFDTYQRLLPRPWSPDYPVRIGAIDEHSLDELGQWPWSRAVLARIVDRLTEMGAAAIAFDVLFAESDRTSPKALIASLPEESRYDLARQELERLPDPDQAFAESLANSPSVLAFAYRDKEEVGEPRPISQKFGISVIGSAEDFPQDYVSGASDAVTPIPLLMEAVPGLGDVSAGKSDADGIVRRVPTVVSIGGTLYPSLVLDSIRIALGGQTAQVKMASAGNEFGGLWEGAGIAKMRIGQAIIPVNGKGELFLYDTGDQPGRYFSIADVLRSDFDPNIVAGRIVLIGATFEGLEDIRSTPIEPVIPGVTIHAQAMEQIANGDYLIRPYWTGLAESAFIVFAGGILIFFMQGRSAIVGLGILLAMLSIAFLGSWWAFKEEHMLLGPVYPALTITALFLSGTLLNFIRTEREKRQVRGAFSRYLSPVLVDQLSRNPSRLHLGGEMRDLTLMFSDIRGFTKISERLDPTALTQFINSYLTPMTSIIQNHEGTIDKYIGDCVMAFWNAPLDVDHHQQKAILAAYAMRDALKEVNKRLQEEADATNQSPIVIRAGIGLNSGPCCVGNLGSEQRFDYSALGDAVNIASRLEALSQSYGIDLVIGEETALGASDFALIEIDCVRVKGKEFPIRIFTGFGDMEVAKDPLFQVYQKTHDQFLLHYRAMEWDEADRMLLECKKSTFASMAGYYSIMAERVAEFRASPPPSDWDGVYVAQSKTG